MSLPKINGLFRLTRDIEIRYLQSGTAVANIGLVASEKYKEQESTCFIDAVAFGKQGEILNQYFKKGDQIYINGKLKLETWLAQDNTKRSKHSLLIEGFDFISANKQETTAPVVKEYAPKQAQQKEVYDLPAVDVNDDEIPF